MQKKLLPYLKRADELETREPLASFYCRLYVADQLMKIRTSGVSDPELDTSLINAIDEAEKLKPSLGPNVATQGPVAFELFCREVFDAAIEGEASSDNQAAASKYYFASLFIEVLTQFGPLTHEFEEMRTFARNRVLILRKGTGSVKWEQVRSLLIEASAAVDAESVTKLKQVLGRIQELI